MTGSGLGRSAPHTHGPLNVDAVVTSLPLDRGASGRFAFAANRAEAVRWALARVRERPAYAQLRERISEIDRLKAEF